MARKGQGQVGKVVDVDLGLVCAGAHDPIAIVADAHALAGLLKLKVLQQVDAVGEFGVVLQTALALADQPLWERAGLAAADCVDGHISGGDLHGGGRQGDGRASGCWLCWLCWRVVCSMRGRRRRRRAKKLAIAKKSGAGRGLEPTRTRGGQGSSRVFGAQMTRSGSELERAGARIT